MKAYHLLLLLLILTVTCTPENDRESIANIPATFMHGIKTDTEKTANAVIE